MDFSLTEEQKSIKAMCRDFCRREIEPIAKQLDVEGRVPNDILVKYADLGLFGMTIPKEYGGSEAGDFGHLLAIEELAYAGTPAWWPVAFNNSVPEIIYRFGTPEQREKYLKKNFDGKKLFSIQFTEPDTGSDPDALRTSSRPDGDYYVINGQKRFSTFGARPGLALVWTKDDTNACTCFIVDKLDKGYSTSELWDLMGAGGAEPVDVYYEDLRVRKDRILGGKGKGFEVLLHWISIEKLEGCIVAVTLAQAALDEAINYTRNRKVRGGLLSDMQGVRFELAEMYTKIEASRWMVYRIAHLLESDPQQFQREVAACKIFVQPLMSEVIASSLRLHGCYGYTKDFKIERLYRAQPGNIVISGSLEINKTIVGNSLVK
jgi:alkylation response protein AidB-like acyl-CoA dehydrogenase